ncbi:MAG: hypothetical protein ACMUIE_03130 [Thermoplasmatota archaeon]
MTTLKELNNLAKECEKCALQDSRSINDHLKECNTCGDYFEKAENFNKQLKEIRDIAKKSESAIHRDVHERISRIANMEDEDRKTALTDLLDAISILPESDRIRFVRTRTEIITDFSKYERDPIIETMISVTKDWDKERKRIEMTSLMKATDDFPVLKKIMIRNMFEDMLS